MVLSVLEDVYIPATVGHNMVIPCAPVTEHGSVIARLRFCILRAFCKSSSVLPSYLMLAGCDVHELPSPCGRLKNASLSQ